MPLFAPRGCIEPDAPDPTGLRLFAGHTDTTAALRWFAGQTGRLFADPAAGVRSGGIKPPPSPRNRHPRRPPIRLDAAIAPAALFPYAQRKASKRSGLGEISDGHLQGGQKARSQARAGAHTTSLLSTMARQNLRQSSTIAITQRDRH